MPETGTPTMPPKPQILLVDDDAIQREVIADILKSDGLSLLTAQSGDEATNALRQKKPPFDLVVTNLVLPKKGGLEVIKAAIKHNPDCTVMALGTFSNSAEASEALAHGAYSVVTKPLRPDHFKNALRRLVERSMLLSEAKSLRDRVSELESKVDALEATKGRMEMLAREISPIHEGQGSRPLEELEQLAALRSKGVLTEAQFQTARQSILSRWLS